jgi:SAM-dependent methyltransferase
VSFPTGFFARSDPSPDGDFYAVARLVTHIDSGAIAAVSGLYEELGVPDGDVLDLMSSWISHLPRPSRSLTVLGLNEAELAANPMATVRVVQDLNREPALPFPDGSFDSVLCCVSVDYLTSPLEVFAEVSRVLRSGGLFICTFSNRLFPTKAVRGWLQADDAERCRIVQRYFNGSGGWSSPLTRSCLPAHHRGDPLYAVWAARSEQDNPAIGPGRAQLANG